MEGKIKDKYLITQAFPALLLHIDKCKDTHKDILLKFNACSEIVEQQKHINLFVNYMQNENDEENKEFATKLVTYLFMSSFPGYPLRKTLFRTLSAFSEKDLLISAFSENFNIAIQNINMISEKKIQLHCVSSFVGGLTSSMDLKTFEAAFVANFNVLFDFAFYYFENNAQFVSKDAPETLAKSTLINLSKFILLAIEKCNLNDIEEEKRLRLIKACCNVMMDMDTDNNTFTTCGHIITILFTALPEKIVKEFSFKERPYLELLKLTENPSQVLRNLGFKELNDTHVLEKLKMCLFANILIVGSPTDLNEFEIDDKIVLYYLLKDLIKFSDSSKIDTSELITLSKAITTALSYITLEKIPLPFFFSMFISLINYTLRYLDEKMEVIRKNCEMSLKYLIVLADKLNNLGCREFLSVFVNFLVDEQISSNRYKIITIMCSILGCDFILTMVPNLSMLLLREMYSLTHSAQICSCYETLMIKHSNEGISDDNWMQSWVYDIVLQLTIADNLLVLQYIQQLFILAFKIRPVTLKALMEQSLRTDSEIIAFLGCIFHARKKNVPISNLPFVKINDDYCWRNLMDSRMLEKLSTHQNDNIRLLTLGIIVDSHRSTESFDDWELNFLLNFLLYNVNTPEASTRQQICAYVKKCLERLNASSSVWQEKLLDKPKLETTENNYGIFLTKVLCSVLLPGLNPDNNYARRSTSLQLLQLLTAHLQNVDRFFQKYWSSDDLNNLQHILRYDTFEHNKSVALQLLNRFSLNSIGFLSEEIVMAHINECMTLIKSKKPMESISGAYMLQACIRSPYALPAILKLHNTNVEYTTDHSLVVWLILQYFIKELDNSFNIAEDSIQSAAQQAPVHGILFSIRQLLKFVDLSKCEDDDWNNCIRTLLSRCHKFGFLCRHIVCNESPEGFLPEYDDANLRNTDQTAIAQMVTVYGWRTVKEISLMFGEIALTYSQLLTEEILKMGEYFKQLLLYTKHRGAFEQTSIGFSKFCSKVWTLQDVEKDWLRKCIYEFLEVDEENERVCSTRRSAGVPFMIQSILVTEPKENKGKVFDECINTLLNTAKDYTKSVTLRVHCINILKALYRHNQLGERIVPYCAAGMTIALDGFESPIWHLRNASTLLFSTLMIRIFGVQRTRNSEDLDKKNRMFAQVFFSRYPGLYNVLLNKMKKSVTEPHSLSLYPALVILSRLYNSKGTNNPTMYKLDSYLEYILMCLSNPNQDIRILAAKTSVHLASHCDKNVNTATILKKLSDSSITDLQCHGLLLQLYSLLTSNRSDDKTFTIDLTEVLKSTMWILECSGIKISYMTATLYLKLLVFLILKVDPDFKINELYHLLMQIVIIELLEQYKAKELRISERYLVYLFHLLICVVLHTEYFKIGYGNMECYQTIRLSLRSFEDLRFMCLRYLNYLKFTSKDFAQYNFQDKEFSEYPELINEFFRLKDDAMKSFLYEFLYDAITEYYFKDGLIDTSLLSDKCLTETFVLHYYPKVLKDHEHSNKQILNFHIKVCEAADDETISFALANFDNFITQMDDDVVKTINFDKTTSILLQFCTSSYDVSYRLGVAMLLVHNKKMFYSKYSVLSWSNMCTMWLLIFILLEDDDETVRNTISQICSSDCSEENYEVLVKSQIDTPEFAKKKVLDDMVKFLPYSCSVTVLLSLILQKKEGARQNLSEVFDEEDHNFAEPFALARLALLKLRKVLWNLEDGLNFEDKSILLEEHFHTITSILYDKFSQNCVPLLSSSMSISASCVLATILLYFRDTQPGCNYKNKLTKVINEVLGKKISKMLNQSEFFRLKMFISALYQPGLYF